MEQRGGERCTIDPEMRRDSIENVRERTDTEVGMIGDRHMMLTALLRFLGRDDFLVHQVESNCLRTLSIVIEVTAHRVADQRAQLLEIVGFRDDRRANRARHVPALSGFRDDEQQFGHGASE